MGRLFVTEIQGPVYKCKHCEIDFAVYEPVHWKSVLLFEYPASFGKLYNFDECYNVVIGTDEVFIGTIEEDIDNFMCEVFCIRCGSHESGAKYNEGNFYINRFKILGPPDGSDNDNPGDETSEGSDDEMQDNEEEA